MQHLQLNTTLQGGKYSIERVLGQGGFGITYRAIMKDKVSGNLGAMEVEVPVAIKEFFMADSCMREENSLNVTVPSTGSRALIEQYRNKFVKEANNLASLTHSNIVKVIEVFEENGTDYYVMEYLEGGSLRDLVKKNGKIEEVQALEYIMMIGKALHYMHRRHICHYDVKPSNIMLDKNGVPKLIDFGISKNYDSAGNQTSSTPIGLSKGFAPIEQYEQSVQEFSPQTDIYALGATLYYLLTGTVPPDASTVFNEGLPKLPSSISASTRDAIEQAMQPRKIDRPETMKHFIFILVTSINELTKKTSKKEDLSDTIIDNDESTLSINNVKPLKQPKRKVEQKGQDTNEKKKSEEDIVKSKAALLKLQLNEKAHRRKSVIVYIIAIIFSIICSTFIPDYSLLEILTCILFGVFGGWLICVFAINWKKEVQKEINKWKKKNPQDTRNKYL